MKLALTTPTRTVISEFILVLPKVYIPMRSLFFLVSLAFFLSVTAQGLDLLPQDEPITTLTKATYKTTRIINGHSIETVSKNEMDLKISHRFGFVNSGAYDLFGLDQATIRIGVDYGITDNLNIGVGRSTYEKTYDGFVKYKFLQQKSGAKNTPITAAWISHMGINTLQTFGQGKDQVNFTHRLHFTHQLLIARKFSEGFSAQITPSFVHRNLVDSLHHNNDVLALGIGVRQKINNRVSVNVEYFYTVGDPLSEFNANALSLGFDIETGGHVFQLFLTNAAAPFEKGFITDTVGKWSKGDIRFGFNVARIFNF